MEIQVQNRDGLTLVILQGEIDGSTAPQIEDAIVPAISPNCHLLMDMKQIEFMSSAGLRMLLIIYRRVVAVQGAIVLTGLSDELQHVMDATGFLKHFKLADSIDEGIGILGA